MSDWKNFWDRLANSKNDLLSGDWVQISKDKYAERMKYIRKMMNLKKEDTLVDIGCGKGLFKHYNKKYIKNYIGLDFSWKMLFEGQKKMDKKNTSCNFIQGNCKCLPFKSLSINKLLANSISHYIDEKEFREMLLEINRVLDDGGTCFLGDIKQKDNPSLSINKKKENNFNFYLQLKLLLKKIKFLVSLKSIVMRIYYELQNRIIDFRRGFKIHRNVFFTYDSKLVLNWMKEINKELECYFLEQDKYKFYSNRYDILIKKQ